MTTTGPATSTNTTSASAGSTTGNATMGNATSTTGAPTTTTGATQMGCLTAMAGDGSLQLDATAANNYAFSSTVTLTPIPIAPKSGLTIDWSGLSIDLLKHPIDPTSDVVSVVLAVLNLTQADFATQVNMNVDLVQFNRGAAAFYPMAGETQVDVYDLVVPGPEMTPIEPEMIDGYLDPAVYPPEQYTFAVLVQDVGDPGHGIRMVQPAYLDPEAVDAYVAVTNESATLSYTTDLTLVQPVQVPTMNPNITVSWSGMIGQPNALGQVWDVRKVDEVMVGHYPFTPAELNERFLDLEQPGVADRLYRAAVTQGNEWLLSTMTDEAGQPFTGIDNSTGTWILALNCTAKCSNPAPWFLTILQPCSG